MPAAPKGCATHSSHSRFRIPDSGFGFGFWIHLTGTNGPPVLRHSSCVFLRAVTAPRFDGNLERIMVDSDEALSGPGGMRRAALQVSTGATLSPIVGPLDYAFDDYRISHTRAA